MDAPSSTLQPSGHVTRALDVVGEGHREVLDPVARFSEVIFGLIMVLTFTSALSVADGGHQAVRDMLVAALGCNIAWGIVDGVMFILASMAARGRAALVYRGLRDAGPADARTIVLRAVPETVAAVLEPADVDRMVARVRALPEPPAWLHVTWRDLRGALASCLLVFLATLPPTLPFVFIHDPLPAQRLSNFVAVACLFLAGHALGKRAGINAWLLGLAMVLLGSALVGLAIVLGG